MLGDTLGKTNKTVGKSTGKKSQIPGFFNNYIEGKEKKERENEIYGVSKALKRNINQLQCVDFKD